MCGGGSDTVQTTQTIQLPAWVEQASEELFATAQPIAEREYPFYDDSRIASFNPDQQASFDLARSQVGSWEPSFANAFLGYGAAGEQFDPWGQPMYSQSLQRYAPALSDPRASSLPASAPAPSTGLSTREQFDQRMQNAMSRHNHDIARQGQTSGVSGEWGVPAGGAQGLAWPYQAAIAGPAEPFVGQAGEFAFNAGSASTPYIDPFLASFFGEMGTGRGTESAYGALGAGQSQVSGADISQYMNPYLQQVQQTTIEELNRQWERDRNARNADMVARGSYLNEDRREAIDNLSRESRDRVIGEMTARTNADAYSQALGQANLDRSRSFQASDQYRGLAGDQAGRNFQSLATSMGVRSDDLSRMLAAGGQFGNLAQLGVQVGSGGLDAALGTRSDDLNRLLSASGGFAQLAPQAQQLGYTDVATMLGLGGQQQGQTQNEMDLAYNEFLRQFYYPEEQINWLTSILGGVPYGQTTMGQQPVGSSNTAGGILGGLAAFGGALGGLGWTPFCWVAREVYGAGNPQWLVFRAWMLTRAPKWLLAAYLKYGERIAWWLRGKTRIKAMVRMWMDARVRQMAGS